ncbi:ATP-dependent DNA helicase [Pseudokineococcus basanitobsidens]|uniref:DNA 3'-5' helicase n=1 Tax=Pseudokineococcus basanitobsidens TaxID=1926649 RepID=A0ABU8RII7_9ACTN
MDERGRERAAGARRPSLRLVRRRRPAAPAPELDPAQRSVVEAGPGGGPVVLLGAPGTGRTTTLVELVAARAAAGADPSSLLLLAPGRLAAASLRDRVGERVARTSVEPAARSWHAYAFALLRRSALERDEPAPRLVSGPEQDRALADLMAGHAAGHGRPPAWPAAVRPALGPTGGGLRGLRDELRDLVMRCFERGVTPEELEGHGRRVGRPEWVAAASVLAEYEEVAALRGGEALDPSALVDAAARLLEDDEELAARERARWSLVGVDDAQEAGAAVARLLDALAPPGAAGPDLVVAGDPDATTQSFRGADPGVLAVLAGRSRVVVLPTRHRAGGAVAAAVRRVAEGVPSAGLVAQRRAADPGDDRPTTVERAVLASSAAEGAHVAHVLREAHLRRGAAWEDMAVLVRSAGRTGPLRRALAGAGVPVDDAGGALPVRDEPAVRPLLLALAVACDLADGRRDALDADAAVELLTSPLGGADAVSLRRLRRRLRAAERASAPGDTPRAGDELLVELLADPAGPAAALLLPSGDGGAGAGTSSAEDVPPDVVPAARVLRALDAARAVVQASAGAAGQAPGGARGGGPTGAPHLPEGSPADPGDAEEVLWALWQATGLSARWSAQALAGGEAGRRADRDLDAVVALFEAVARFADSAVVRGPRALLAQLGGQDLRADTLAERASAGGRVALLTPQAASGREYRLVVVAGLQDGVWPDPRVRDGLLGASALVDLLAGRGDGSGRGPGARAAVLADERRLLHVAVSRASERLVVTAVDDGEQRPSPYLDLVAPPPPGAQDELTRTPRALTLPALVAELRQALAAPVPPGGPAAEEDARRRADAAAELARLAAAGVPGADPDDWYGLAPLSDDGPLSPGAEPVPVSPSKVEVFGRCPLRWVLEASGAVPHESSAAGTGTLVHDIAARHPDADRTALGAELDRRWHELGLRDTWPGRRERRTAEEVLDLLAPYLAGAGGRDLVGTEVEVRVAVGRALLTGRVDRLERDEQGRLVVVDLKTGTPAKGADVPRHPQLGAYQAAVEAGAFVGVPGAEGERRSGGAVLVNVKPPRREAKEQRQPPLAADEQPGWAAELVGTTAEGMAGAAFPARDGDLCRTCPVRTSCPVRDEGRQVGR